MITIPERELTTTYRNSWENKQNYDTVSKLLSKKGAEQVTDFLERNDYKKIIIYGVGVFGKLLFDMLKAKYTVELVDQKGGSIFDFGEYEINRSENFDFSGHDICIVTPIASYESIKAFITKKGFDNCVSLYDVLNFAEKKGIFL